MQAVTNPKCIPHWAPWCKMTPSSCWPPSHHCRDGAGGWRGVENTLLEGWGEGEEEEVSWYYYYYFVFGPFCYCK